MSTPAPDFSWVKPVAIAAVVLLAVLVLIVARSNGVGQDCIVTAMGGSKLCGEDAKAWCDSTDSIRSMSEDTQSQSVCDEIRGR